MWTILYPNSACDCCIENTFLMAFTDYGHTDLYLLTDFHFEVIERV